MKNINLHRGTTVILFVLLAFTTGCYYDSVVPPEIEVKDVIFSTQVEPIFYTDEKCTSCHIAGGTASFLDLSQGIAFTSINDPKYIDVASPESSLIYTKPAPGQAHFKSYTNEEAAYVLQWIKEGAEDN
jgi:hypothetical protein